MVGLTFDHKALGAENSLSSKTGNKVFQSPLELNKYLRSLWTQFAPDLFQNYVMRANLPMMVQIGWILHNNILDHTDVCPAQTETF